MIWVWRQEQSSGLKKWKEKSSFTPFTVNPGSRKKRAFSFSPAKLLAMSKPPFTNIVRNALKRFQAGFSMKTLFDTSVIVAGVVESHPMHARCLTWLQRAKSRAIECIVVSHSLAETYAVLTTLPVKPQHFTSGRSEPHRHQLTGNRQDCAPHTRRLLQNHSDNDGNGTLGGHGV